MMQPEPRGERLGIALVVGIVAVLAMGSVFFAMQAGIDFPLGARDDEATVPEVDVTSLEFDPTTELPLVPTTLLPGRPNWIPEPSEPLDRAARYASDVVASDGPGGAASRVSLVAALGDHAAAREVAEQLAAAVGDPAAEAAWLGARGQGADRSFEWVGGPGETPFVQVVDRWLLVDGLGYRRGYDLGSAADPASQSYRSPLAQALALTAEAVYVEGDRRGLGVASFEIICEGDPDRLLTLAHDLADHEPALAMRAPWLEPGIGPDERRARRTLRLLQALGVPRFLAEMRNDPGAAHLQAELEDAIASGDETAIAQADDRLDEYLRGLVAASLPDVAAIEHLLDADVLAARIGDRPDLAALTPPPSPDTSPSPSGQPEDERLTFDAQTLRDAEPFGASVAADPLRSGEADYEVLVDGGKLSLVLGSWFGVAQGLGPLVDYLAASGCEVLALDFIDPADVVPPEPVVGPFRGFFPG